MSAEAFAAFREAVLGDEHLQRELSSADPDRRRFAVIAAEAARGRGFDVDPIDVEAAIHMAHAAWQSRWI